MANKRMPLKVRIVHSLNEDGTKGKPEFAEAFFSKAEGWVEIALKEAKLLVRALRVIKNLWDQLFCHKGKYTETYQLMQ